MSRPVSTLALVGNETFRHISASRQEVQLMVQKLKAGYWPVVQFGRVGWDCERDGIQIFRATAMDDHSERFHVKINSTIFPDV
jgi:hypothetical protein